MSTTVVLDGTHPPRTLRRSPRRRLDRLVHLGLFGGRRGRSGGTQSAVV